MPKKQEYALKAVGSDPEFFLRDKKGQPAVAIGQIGGDKVQPRHINDDGFSAVQEDNVMVEYNIRPARTADEFAKNHKLVLDYLDNYLKEKGFRIDIVPTMEFKKKQLKHPQAREIGCMGDFNAWTWKPNPRPTYQILKGIRTAGAHVHVSYEYSGKQPSLDDQTQLVRMCDLSLGVPSIILDDDTLRRKFYGKAGCFRPKDYGVEYRTLSNFWIKSPELMKWVFSQVVWSVRELNRLLSVPSGMEELQQDHNRIQDCINGAQSSPRYARDLAKSLIKKYAVPMPA